ERIRRSKLIVIRPALFKAHNQRVVLGLDARLEIYDPIRPSDYRVEDRSDRAADDEVSSEIVQIVGSHREVPADLALESNVRLLDHRILHFVVDDVDSSRTCSGQDKPGERIRETRRKRRKLTLLIQEEKVSGAHLDRKRTSVKPTFERLYFQSNPVVVDPISAMNAGAAIAGCPVETDTRSKIVFIAMPFAG